MKKLILFLVIISFLVTNSNSQTVTDFDGNNYNTVTIGTQVWLKENLKVTHYRNGDSIPNVTDSVQWSNMKNGAYCNYNNSIDTSKTYGRLYNWYSVNDSRNIAPSGWHVPTDTELIILTNYLGGNSIAGGKMKEIGINHWNSPNTGATNLSDFTALPGGSRSSSGTFGFIGTYGTYWSSTEGSKYGAYYLSMFYGTINVWGNYNSLFEKMIGFSVRCIKDTPTQINEINEPVKINIYPNPAVDKIFINFTIRQNLKMQVFNTIGECVLQKELNNVTNTVDISSLTKGIYIMKFTSPNGTIEKKLIKE